MSRKPRVQRTPEEKWQIVLEGLKSGNVAETCRKYEIAPNLYYRWKDEVEAGAKAALGGRSAAAQPDAEQGKRRPKGTKQSGGPKHWRSAGRASIIGGNRAPAVRIARATRRSSWPAARSRPMGIVGWSGGWGGITGWWSMANGLYA